jgi:hypothetical protein
MAAPPWFGLSVSRDGCDVVERFSKLPVRSDLLSFEMGLWVLEMAFHPTLHGAAEENNISAHPEKKNVGNALS